MATPTALTRLSLDNATSLPGPDWLRARRGAAFARFESRGLPTDDEEIWRHSRIWDLELDSFAPAPNGADDRQMPAAVGALLDAIGPTSKCVLERNGWIASIVGDGAKGLRVERVADSPSGKQAMGEPGVDCFTELNTALAPEPVLVDISSGSIVAEPIVVVHWIEDEHVAAFPRTVIRAAEASQVTVVEIVASDDVTSLVVPVTEIAVSPGAVVRHLTIEVLGRHVWQLSYQRSDVGAQASLTSATVALGGDYARFRIDADIVGEGGSADLVAVYFGDGEQMHDFRTLQDHHARRGTSDLLFKGAVAGSAHAVYSGLIRVNPGASGTSAFLTNRNVVLSDSARAFSVPNLEIINENDLRNCGHAAASGPIDADQRFYLESRGVPSATAERLIVLGFFADILDRIPLPGIRVPLRDEVAARLARVPL